MLSLRSLVKYGTGDFWCRLVCETGSRQTFTPLRVVGGFGNSSNISLCLDFLTVFAANFFARSFLLAGSISSFRSLQPLSYSFPVIVATAFLWILERQRDCLCVIAPAQTGQFASRWTLPSLFPEQCQSCSINSKLYHFSKPPNSFRCLSCDVINLGIPFQIILQHNSKDFHD